MTESAVEVLLNACCSPSGSVPAWSRAVAALKRQVAGPSDELLADSSTIDRILAGCIPVPRSDQFADEGGSISVRNVQAHGNLSLAVTLSIECASLALAVPVLSIQCPFFTPVEEPESRSRGRATVIEEVEKDSDGFASALLRVCGYTAASEVDVPWADGSTDDRALQLLERLASRTSTDVQVVR